MAPNYAEYEYVIVGGGPATRILNHYVHMMNPGVSVAVVRNEGQTTNKCSIPYIKLIFATGSEEAIPPIRLPGRQSAGGGR